ncbi:unnamed protein product, partial [Rotaria magnacalcarata]
FVQNILRFPICAFLQSDVETQCSILYDNVILIKQQQDLVKHLQQ